MPFHNFMFNNVLPFKVPEGDWFCSRCRPAESRRNIQRRKRDKSRDEDEAKEDIKVFENTHDVDNDNDENGEGSGDENEDNDDETEDEDDFSEGICVSLSKVTPC